MAEVTSFVVSVAGGTFFDIPIGSGAGAAIQPGHTLEIAAQWANNGSPSPSFSYTGGTPTTPPTNRVAWSSPGSGSISSGVWTWVVEPGITNIRMTFSPSDDGNAIVTAFEDVTAIKVPGSPPAWAGASATTATSPTIASVEAGAIVHAGVDIASGSEPVSIVTAGGTVVGEGPERKGFVARFSQVTTGTVSGKQFSWPTAGAYRPRAWAIAYEFPPPDPPIEATLMTEPYPGASGDVADGITIIPNPINPNNSVAIGTNKSTGSDGGLYVFDMDGEILSSQTGFTANSVDWRDTTGLSGWDGRILVMTCDRTSGDFALVFFWFDRTTRTLTSAGTIPVLNEPYGTCLGINSGVLYAYMTERGPDDVSPREFYQASLVRSGDTVTLGSIVRQFTIPSVVEGMAVSDADNALIMSQEDVGLFALGAGPAGGDWDDRLTIDLVGSGNLVADVEDVAIVNTPDGPRVLVSSQGDNSYHVYSWDEIAEEYVHEMRFTVVRPDGTTQVTGTDGLDALHVNLGTNFPNGLIAVHDDGSDPSVFAFIDAAEVFGPLDTPEGGFEATYLFGPAAASGVQDATGGFATAYAFGPADASSDTEHRGGFEGTYLFGPAEAEGEAPAGGVFETTYAFGEADASGEATYSGGFEAAYSFGPAEAEGHVDVEGGFEAAWVWGPADAGGSSPTGGGFSAAYEFGPADAGGEADYSGEFAAAYEFGPASATGGGSAVGGFTTTWAWGPADAGGAAEPEGDFEAAYAFGPAEASGESAGGGGFAATYGWGVASAGGEADYSGGFTTTYLFGPAGFAGSTTAEPCWPTMFLVPDGPSTTLIPEGPVMNLVEDGCRP